MAADKGTEAALLFATGYQANAATIAALLDRSVLGAEPLVFADRLNHASMHLGCALAGAKQVRFRHVDLSHLQALLEKHADEVRPKVILSETVFGMDGDLADVAALQDLAPAPPRPALPGRGPRHGRIRPARLRPERGPGPGPEHRGHGHHEQGPGRERRLRGLLAPCARLSGQPRGRIHLLHRALRPWWWGAALCAWELLPGLGPERAALLARAERLRQGLRDLGLDTGSSCTQIVPVLLGTPERTLAARSPWRPAASASRPCAAAHGAARDFAPAPGAQRRAHGRGHGPPACRLRGPVTGLVFLHGWGFGPFVWADWVEPPFPSGPWPCSTPGTSARPASRCRTIPAVGSASAIPRALRSCSAWTSPGAALVGFGAFLRFCALPGRNAGTPQATLDAMIARLDTGPGRCAAGASPGAAGSPPAAPPPWTRRDLSGCARA